MIGELMSTGNIVPLPENTVIRGFPQEVDPEVTLMLPFGRVLVGVRVLGGLEQWLWGKLGVFPWRELSLLPGRPARLVIEGLGEITLSPQTVGRLRLMLLSRATPPGDHFLTVSQLRGLLGDSADLSVDPAMLWRTFLIKPHLRRAYWGVRFGLLWGGTDMVGRIGVWLKYAPIAFEGLEESPSLWTALSGIPSQETRVEIASFGFAEERFFHLRAGDANPGVFRSDRGVLLHYLHEGFLSKEIGSRVPFRIWVYLPMGLWERLRDRNRIPLREIMLAWWGYVDAGNAEKWFRPYRLSGEMPLSLGQPLNVP